jgi:hypothetical protein
MRISQELLDKLGYIAEYYGRTKKPPVRISVRAGGFSAYLSEKGGIWIGGPLKKMIQYQPNQIPLR